MPLAAAVTAHLGLFAGVIGVGFAIGAVGHMVGSRALVVVGIIVIASVSLYFVASGEVQT